MDDQIRLRAYEIWERNGRSGDPAEHWYEAERELTLASLVNKVPKARAKKPRSPAVPASTKAKAKSAPKHVFN